MTFFIPTEIENQLPDFNQPGFAMLVELVMANGALMREEAIAAMAECWHHQKPPEQLGEGNQQGDQGDPAHEDGEQLDQETQPVDAGNVWGPRPGMQPAPLLAEGQDLAEQPLVPTPKLCSFKVITIKPNMMAPTIVKLCLSD
ncbi:hypothetical protein ID866_11836 [Astraeus odoratus]|nr:hypothetical protein ID866_11836 [Astraeus odoratus]